MDARRCHRTYRTARFGLGAISTTQTLVGAIMGVGLARGIAAINLTMVRNIVISWIVTVPAGAFFAIIIFYIFKAIIHICS